MDTTNHIFFHSFRIFVKITHSMEQKEDQRLVEVSKPKELAKFQKRCRGKTLQNSVNYIAKENSRASFFCRKKKMLVKHLNALIQRTGCEATLILVNEKATMHIYATAKSINFATDSTVFREYEKSLSGKKDTCAFSHFCKKCGDNKTTLVLEEDIPRVTLSDNHIHSTLHPTTVSEDVMDSVESEDTIPSSEEDIKKKDLEEDDKDYAGEDDSDSIHTESEVSESDTAQDESAEEDEDESE